MVSSVGEAAVSGVSLVDTFNTLMIQIMSALATGGAVVTSQYIGHQEPKNAKAAAAQILFVLSSFSVLVAAVVIGGRHAILRGIFGSIDADVMRYAETYFLLSALSYPFIGLYNGFHNPQAVLDGKANNSFADGWSPIASHYKEITLAAGESKTLVFILGYVEMPAAEKFEADGKTINKVKSNAMIEKYNTPEKVAAGLAELRETWDKLLGILNVDTPDDKVNRMVNI